MSTSTDLVPFRIAIRSGADGYVTFYLAEMNTMEGATELLRVPKKILVADPELFNELQYCTVSHLNRYLVDTFGLEAQEWITQEAPEQQA